MQHGTNINEMNLSCTSLHLDSVVTPAWLDIVKKPELVPGIVIKPKGEAVRHAVLQWTPMETADQGFGLGRLPLLRLSADTETITIGNFPARPDLGRALAGHLRAVTAVAHAKDEADLLNWMARAEPRDANQTIKHTWPRDKAMPDQSGRTMTVVISVDPVCEQWQSCR